MNRLLTALLLIACSIPSSPFHSAQATAAESSRPNILLVMVDDLGFSDLGYHGGEIDTPNLDALALGGVRFSQFYNAGRCCPTRASLMTGLHPHQCGIGHMTSPARSSQHDHGVDGYRGFINDRCVTAAEVLRDSGYATLMAGKWHLGYDRQQCWPLQRGFDKYFGCISGATRYFHPEQPNGMMLGNQLVETPQSTTDEAFYTTDAFTDYAIRFITEHVEGERREQPFFLYLAYTAPHWPLQAFEEDISKYRGRYKIGWDELRQRRYHRQVQSGLIDPAWQLSPRTEGVPAWDSLDEKTQDDLDLKMAIFAAMVDRVDQNVGRLVQHLKDSGTYDNTLILFLSDNGACQEGGMLGRGEFADIEKRNQEHNNSYGEAWANAGSTPFRLYKHFVHEGGAATPFFMHWPAGIRQQDDWYHSPAQLIDILPTLLDVAAADYPQQFRGNPIPPLQGVSLRPAISGRPLDRSSPLFFEHENNAAIREGQWKLVGRGVAGQEGVQRARWELYDLAQDRTETNNLATKHPQRARRMAQQWDLWANLVGVYPKGNAPVPALVSTRAQAETEPPQVRSNPLRISATIDAAQPNGVVLSHGGIRFGYSLHFVDGRPAFSVRNQGKLTELIAGGTVSGRVTIQATLDDELMSITVDDKLVVQRKSPGLLTAQPAIGFYLGHDYRDPVGDYQTPNRFDGELISHQIEVGPPKVTMRTPWGAQLEADQDAQPWTEYPRPAMRRDQWTNLNGYWDYSVTSKDTTDAPQQWDGEIRVPFAIESPLSGVERRFGPDDVLWYHRKITVDKRDDRRYLLNFEAVDYQSSLYINGQLAGTNTGGNLPFSHDVTDTLKDGENDLVLRVADATDTAYQLHGKQRLQPKDIWYTPVSGIWQTVWLEEVPPTHIHQLKMTANIDGKVTIALSLAGDASDKPANVTVALDGEVVATAQGPPEAIEISIPDPQLWSPQSPTLYQLKIQYADDVVESYVGLREVGKRRDADGHWRFTLNGEDIFPWGTLDQGWWPDGLLTPPSDEAMRWDIEFLKEAGFNTLRKHIKVEPRRYYYHCDKLGMMVWQDQVSAMADNPPWTRLDPNPETRTWPAAAHGQFMTELKGMIDLLHNHPSIVQWVPFNEAWGQHQSMEVGRWTVEYDPTRHVNIASGGNFFPVGDVVDHHQYPHPGFPFHLGEGGRFDDFIKVIGEFGGHGFPVQGHLWDPKTRNWGYGDLPGSKQEWLDRYRESIRLLAELRDRGIAAGIYTQTTDVEGEINGLITYDRKVVKIPAPQLREIHRAAGLVESAVPR